jgi:hypothetical protein
VTAHVQRTCAFADHFEQLVTLGGGLHRFGDVAAAATLTSESVDFGDNFVGENYV